MYLRSAEGALINTDHVLRYLPDKDKDGNLQRWLAVCTDGKSRPLDPYYAVPGRLERAIGFTPEDARPQQRTAAR